jgi:FKBP-type peptidyl-prolyl cis-trans isomerase 2
MDFIKINYTGRVKDGPVFDTTDAETAKKEKLFDSRRAYKPLSVAVGEKQVIEALDEELAGMKVGDKKTVTAAPEKAYGQKNPAYVRLVPVKFFKQEKISPVPGMPVEIDGMRGRVQTFSGGRVRVDFNHELAGKTLVFDVEVVDRAKSEEEKAMCLVERNFESDEGFGVQLSGKKLTVKLPRKAFHDRNIIARKASFSAEAFKFLEASDVTFQETWENPKVEARKEDAKKEDKAEKKK